MWRPKDPVGQVTLVGGTSGAPGHPWSWRAQLRTHVHQQWTGCTRCRCAAARASESASVTLGQLACWASVCAGVLSKEVLHLQQTRTASGRAVGGTYRGQQVVYEGRLLGVANRMEAPSSATSNIEGELVLATKALKHTDTVGVLKHSDTVESIKHSVGVLKHTDTVGALPSLERQCRPATKKCSLPAVPRLSLGEAGRLLDERDTLPASESW